MLQSIIFFLALLFTTAWVNATLVSTVEQTNRLNNRCVLLQFTSSILWAILYYLSCT